MNIPTRQLVEFADPQTARVASMLARVLGLHEVSVVVDRFELRDAEGNVLQATPEALDQVLEGLRSHSSEAVEIVLARYASKLREAFRP